MSQRNRIKSRWQYGITEGRGIMLELKGTGKCCSGIQAIEFMESLADVIDEDTKTTEFCKEFEEALNRFRCEVAKGIGRKKRILRPTRRGLHELCYCGKCGAPANEVSWNYCPNCGTMYAKQYDIPPAKALKPRGMD